MKRIVLIGGGDNGGNLSVALESQIANLFNKQLPHALFVPFASDCEEEAYAEFRTVYEGIGFTTDCLREEEEFDAKLFTADLVYLGAGSTWRLREKCQSLGLVRLLLEAYERGITIAGFSAGANYLCRRSVSSEEVVEGNKALVSVDGLGLLDLFCCTHFNYENRKEDFLKRLETNEAGIGLEDHTALVVSDDGFKILSVGVDANVYRVIWEDGQITQKLWE